MTPDLIPTALRKLVRQRANYRCEYCHTPEWISGIKAEIDHIIPLSQGGETSGENLCLACSACNAYKQAQVKEIDPESGNETAIYHPRLQKWEDHFIWRDDGYTIHGVTPAGRVTVIALRMNNELIVGARRIWNTAGFEWK